jgi:hypothetical protein
MVTAPLEQIAAALIRRFKEHVATAVTALAEEKFTLTEIRAGKNVRSFIQAMFWHAKAAEMSSTYNQLVAMWNGLDLPLRMQITMPTIATTTRKFMEELDAKEPIFIEMANRNRDRDHRDQSSKGKSQEERGRSRPSSVPPYPSSHSQ